MAPSGKPDALPAESVLTPVLTAAFAVLLVAYNPIAAALPGLRSVQAGVLAGAILLSGTSKSSVLRDRLLHAPRNWAKHPLRSALEWAAWLCATQAAQAAVLSDLTTAALAALGGAAVCYAGEELTQLSDRVRAVRKASAFDPAPAFFPDGAPLAPPDARGVSMSEVRAHSRADDCWIVVRGAVLDVTAWAKQHPGGSLVITALAGRDASDQFEAFHGRAMGSRLRAMCVGRLDAGPEEAESPAQREFRRLRGELEAEGAFSYDLRRTLQPMYLPLALMAAAMIGLAGASRLAPGAAATLAAVACGAGVGLAWQQMSLFGHDIGHGNVTGSFSVDHAIGLALVPFFGIGISWWKATHNTHHVVTNSESHDPDIQHLPVFAVSARMLKGFWSAYHRRTFAFDAAARVLVGRQRALYYPVMAVAKVNLYLQTHLYLLAAAARTCTLETLGMGLHYVWAWGMARCLPGPGASLAFLLAAVAVAGVLHVQITLSHFSRDTIEGVPYGSPEDSWWRVQLAGTVDVACAPRMDWFHGGLQYQVVHHLFPRLPRHALRPAAARVAAAADRAGLRYEAVSFWEANRRVCATLAETAAEARRKGPGGEGPGAPLLWDALHARG